MKHLIRKSPKIFHRYVADLIPLLQRVPWVVISALLPISVGNILKLPRIVLGNFTDAIFYLAYARHFEELVLRYGFPYYATRFGGILPDALSGALCGEINGIWIIRYFLAAGVSAGLFHFFRKRYGVLAGLLASLFWSLNPAAIRLLCTTYVDSTAVPFLTIACCLYASGWGGKAGPVLCGTLVALAASAHLYAAFALLLLSPWFLASRWGSIRQFFLPLCWMALGFLGTFAAGALWYWSAWEMPALFSPTLEVLRDLGNGGAAQWKMPLEGALRETPAWFAPVVLLIPVAYAAFGEKRALVRGIALSLAASLLFFWGGDLFGKAYVLSMPFYYSFLLPVTILAGATLCAELLMSQQGRTARALLFLGFVAALVVPVAHLDNSYVRQFLLCCVVAILPLLPVWKILQRRLLILLSVVAISMAGVLVGSTTFFSFIYGHEPKNDILVLELASALRHELPKATNDPGVMRFWYDDDLGHPGGEDRRMIGSFWLHWFGKLKGDNNTTVPFPEMSVSDAAAISRSSVVDRIVLFDQDPGQVSKALEVIRERRLPFHISKRVLLSARSDTSRTLEIAILDRQKSDRNISSSPWDLHSTVSLNHGAANAQGEFIEMTSGTVRWLDFAKMPLGDLKKGEGLRLRFKIGKGMIRFCLQGDQKVLFSENVGKWRTEQEQEIVLTAPMDVPDAVLILESIYPDGAQSSVLLYQIEKLTPPGEEKQ